MKNQYLLLLLLLLLNQSSKYGNLLDWQSVYAVCKEDDDNNHNILDDEVSDDVDDVHLVKMQCRAKQSTLSFVHLLFGQEKREIVHRNEEFQ